MLENVDQTIFEPGKGNCLAACLATVLRLPLSALPNFAECGYYDGMRIWLRERGMQMLEVRFSEPAHCSSAWFGYDTPIGIGWGKSPRSRPDGKPMQHAVVVRGAGYGLEIVFDPHPSRDGLDGGPYGVAWIVRSDVSIQELSAKDQ